MTDPKNTTNSTGENWINRKGVALGLPETPIVPALNLSTNNKTLDPMEQWENLVKYGKRSDKIEAIPLSSFSQDSRYDKGTRPGDNWEEVYAQNQTLTEKAIYGVTKGLNLAGTTVAGGFANVLVGLPAWALTGDITKIWNNPVNQGLQEWNEKVDREILPNFYTQQEQDAEWWSRDNWMTGNFLFDKLIKNSGYAVGAMVGGNIANALLLRAGAGIGAAATNLASRITTTGEMSQAFKLSSKLLRNTARAFSRGKNIEAYEASVGKLSSIADLAKREQQLAQLTKTAYSNFGDNGRRTLVALYSSAGEASMEAIMGGNQMKDNLIQKYIDENGIEPTGQALEDINNTVREFGKVSFFGNMALLGLTEYVQLPYLAGSSWKNTRNAIKNTTNDVIAKGGKLVEDLPTTRFGKLYKGAKNYGKYVFDPKEAGQEIGQFALEVGTSNYFEKANETTAAEDWMDAVLNIPGIASYGFFGRDEKGEGVGALVSKEGIEGGILGGITGGLMQAPMKFAETKARKTNTQRLIEESNNAPLVRDVVIDRINTANRGTVLQQQQQVAALQNDILESKDLKTDLAFNYAMHKVKYGRTDLVLDELADMKQQVMTGKEGFPELQGEGIGNTNDTKEEFLARITELETFVKDLDSTYEQLNTIYGAETIKDASTGELRRRFSDAAIERLAYATTKMKDYDARIPQLKSKLASKGIVVDQALSDVVNNPESTSIDEKLLEVDAFDSTMYTDADKNELKQTMLDVTDLTLRKKLFIDEFNQIIKKPENYTQNVSTKSSIETTEETDVPKDVIKIKTSRGEVDVETGTEYVLGRVIDYTKDGQEVFRAPLIKVIKDNGDGTVKLQDLKTNEIFDVEKSKIEDYYLMKTDQAGPAAKFVLENWNTIFQHKGIKYKSGPLKGKGVTGRIENNKGTLIFVYKNEKGEVKRIPVTKSQFEAQGDYKKGMISPVRKLNAVEEKALVDLIGSKEENTEDQISARNEFLSKLYEDGVKRIDAIEKSLSVKRDEIEKISEKLDILSKTKTGEPRKRITSTLRQQINSLTNLKNSLEKQIEQEELEKQELEYTVPFFKDMIEELSEFPEDNSAFIDKLKADVNLLEDLINITDQSINDGRNLLSHVEDLLKDALEIFGDYVKRLKEENPNIPLFLDEFISNLEKFYGEEGVKLFIEQRQGFTAKVLELEADINDFENELSIPGLTKRAETLIEETKDLSEGIDKLIAEQIARREVLEKFQKFVDEKKQMEAEEEVLSTNPKFREQALKTEDKSTVQTKYTNPNYEPNKKKASNILPISTVGIDRGKPHQTRARIFGANLPKYTDVFSVYVNENNEELYGLSGMIDLIRTDDGVINESIASDKILALVMVNGNGQLLGMDGKPLSEEQLADAKNHAIFQVKPDPDFTWKSEKYGKGEDASMFRKGTPENVKKAIIEKYKKEKEALLAETGKGIMHTVASSWGIPEFELNEEGQINYEAKNSVESTGLIDKTTDKGNNSLEGQQVVNIPTVNDVESQGLTSYSDALGKPFLMKDNAVVPLINKKHTQEEAESIFNALLELSKIAMEGKKGMKDPKAVRILNYLRGVVYWGIPAKNTGYNSIFFDTNPQTGKLTLTISNKGYDVVFTPSELERNRGEVIDKIKNLHNNINSSLVKKINQKFEQIVSISPSGEINSIVWPNYQSYLLADRFPDSDGKITTKGKKRESNDIPLTTPMRKLKNNEDVNRHSIYFYTTDTLDDYTFQELKEAKKEASKKMTPGKVSSSGGAKYKLDNETDNLFITPGGKELFFTSPSNVNEDNFLSVIKLAIEPAVMSGFIESEQNFNPELTKEQAIQEVVKNLKAGIFKSIVEFKSQPVEGASTETGGASRFDKLKPKSSSQTGAPVSTNAEAKVEQPTEGGSRFDKLRAKTSESASEQPSEKKMTLAELKAKRKENLSKPKPKDTGLRVVINQKINSVEDWNEVEAFVKKAMPIIPFYRVKNILQATNGKQAWGMLQDAAIYVYENAEVGTAYHEVFEAVWKMFSTPEEQQNIIKEFKSRTGTFVDRPTGKTVKYSDATNQEIKEQLAEEFRDYVQYKKVPVKPKDGRPYIVKLFADIINTIKTFFLGPQAARNTEELFKRIGKGYYAKNNKYSTALSYANKGIIDINEVEVGEEAELREKLTDFEISDVVEEMTYSTIVELVGTNKNLFTEINLPKSDLYPMLEAHIENLLMSELDETERMYEDGEISKEEYDMLIEQDEPLVLERINEFRNSWDEIVVKFEEKLNSFGIEFDENDNAQLTNEDKTKEIEYDATKIDHFKKANSAIKLLLATLPKMNADGTRVLSSINGNKMIPVGQVYVSLLNNLSSSKNTDEMLKNLKEMAENDINYRRLYKRLTKQDYDQGDPSLSKLKYTHEVRLISALWKSVKKYNAVVKNVQILDNGDINVGDAALSTVANQLRDKYISNIIADAKQNKGYFTYNESVKAYTGNPIRLRGVDLTNNEGIVKFLNEVGISFSVNELTNLEINDRRTFKSFKDAVYGIRKSITDADPIFKFTKTSLGISGNLLKIGFIKAKLENPIVNSTHYNINGDLTQSYIGPNVPSQLYEFLSSAEGLTPEAFQNFPHFSYLLTDSFVEGSVLLDKMFTGDRTQRKKSEDADNLFKAGYAGGTKNDQKGKAKESSKLNYRERLIQELNLNLEGWYLNLVPGDSSLEHDIYMSNLTSADELTSGMNTINSVFKGYFMSELKMSREDRPVVKGRDSKDLRFFKSILADNNQKTDAKINKLHNDIINEPKTKTPEEVYKKYEKKINAALDSFIEKDTVELINTLISYNIIKLETSMSGETTYTVSNIKIDGRLSKEELIRTFKAITINYMSANIELQKLIYSDPYQYSDQLKRTKSFDSPRQLIVGGQDSINDVFNDVWNKGYEKDDIGNTDFKSQAFKTVTLQDVTGVIDLPGYGDYTETDGSGIISYKAYRHLRIRAGEWNDAEESQYRYDVAWEKRDKNLKLSPEEETILEQGNPQVQSAYTTQKPIVSGNKADGNTWNDIVLDKFALYPLSYRVMKELNSDSNAVKLYDKMQAEKIDYVVFESGRKVGALNAHPLYVNGKFNDALFVKEGDDRNVINVPFDIMSIQTEVPSKEKALVTRGSQVTKLITLDFMNAGVPVDFEVTDSEGNPIKDFATIYSRWYSLSKEEKLESSELYREMTRNQELLEAITEEGYNSLLKSLGIVKTKDGYRITDKSKTAQTLRKEILKREVNDNVSKALLQFFDNDVILESTPAYQQVRNILYSIADREFISPKISGGMKVQIPSTLLESVRAEEQTINGKTGYVSNNLKFYTDKDGERVAEFMVGRWFKSDMSDAELLKYLNTTDEGQKILSGVAFRIPTQKQNSIDRFVIKQFLPKEFGDNVVVPAELVAKVGSDFDIDKLSMYFKNVFVSSKGDIKLIELKGTKEETINFYSEEFDKLNKDEQDYILRQLNKIQLEEEIDVDKEEKFIEKQEKLNLTKEDWLNSVYKKALQNAYIESSENLISHPMNFKALIQPNSANQLNSLSKDIVEKTVGSTFDYKNVGNMLNRNFMSRLRHAFVTGKYAIGIAAVNQTNQSLNQRQPILLDVTRIAGQDKYWLSNGSISFKKYNKISIKGRVFPTLSLIRNAERSEAYPEGQDISDLIGQFIDGYVDIAKGPWIMELGATPNVASTWLFLIKLGVPVEDVAYFMNQPIVRDYLKSIETAGYSYLFMEDFVDDMLSKYTRGSKVETTEVMDNKRRAYSIPNLTYLKQSVGKDISKMSVQDLEQQRLMLFEFLKYAKMGEQLFHVTQGSNFDTSSFNDPYLVFKKQIQVLKAQGTIFTSIDEDGKTMIPAVDAILKNSFIGPLAQSIYNFRDSISESDILMSDKKKVRAVLQNVLLEYVDMNNRDFVKLAQKAVNDFFDWVVQTKAGDESLNRYIKEYLVDNGGITPEVASFLKEAKNDPAINGNLIVQMLEIVPSAKAERGGANNIKIKITDNQVSDQNAVIFAFRELRDYLQSYGGEYENLYEQIVLTSMLQSGLSNSPISFSSLLPYEDFQPTYNSILSRLDNIEGIDKYYELGVFQKSNWNNDDIVPNEKAGSTTGVYNPAMEYLKEHVKISISKNQLPVLLTQSVRSRSARFDHMVYSYEVDVPITEADKEAKIKTQKQKKDAMRKAGNYSFIKKGLFRKVKDTTKGTYLTYGYTDKNGNDKEYYVYKLVNAWGESFRANEFYDVERPSVIENGMMTTDEFNDAYVVEVFRGGKKSLSQKISEATTKPNISNAEKVSTSEPTISDIDNDYMYEPFTYEESNFDIYDEPNNSLSLPTEVKGMTNLQSGKEEFNKLPGKSSTPTMTYAGIGSRETPKEVMDQMTELAKELESRGYTLRSGGAQGADTAFERGATSKKEIFPGGQKAGEREMKIAREIHPNPQALDNSKNPAFVWNLMARNTNQVFGKNLNTPVDFVIAYTQDGLTDYTKRSIKSGGTGQAIDMASRKGIPVINLANPNWRQELDRLLSDPTQTMEVRSELSSAKSNKPDGLPSITRTNKKC